MTELGRRVLIGLAVVSLFLVAWIASPFAEPLLLAAVLAAASSPIFEKLAARLGQRRTLAAAVFIIAIVFSVVLPFVGILFAVVQQADDAIRPLSAAFKEKGMEGVLRDLPEPVPMVVREISARLPAGDRQFLETLQGLTGRMLSGLGAVFLATGSILFQTAMMLVGLFFMLAEGPRLVAWIVSISPLTEEQTSELLDDFRDVSIAVLVGSVGTALAQSLVALIGFWLAGANHPLLLTVATFIGAFIPVVGAGSVVVLSALILFFTGHSREALLLAIWGVGVVASIDNFIKPYLMRGRLEVNTGVIFFALLGGVAVFGPIGLLAGPLVVAFFLAVVRMCKKELSDGRLRTMTLQTIPPGKIPLSALAAAAAAAVGAAPPVSGPSAPAGVDPLPQASPPVAPVSKATDEIPKPADTATTT